MTADRGQAASDPIPLIPIIIIVTFVTATVGPETVAVEQLRPVVSFVADLMALGMAAVIGGLFTNAAVHHDLHDRLSMPGP